VRETTQNYVGTYKTFNMKTFHEIVAKYKAGPEHKFIKEACVSIELDLHIKMKAIEMLKKQCN
jgi:hypothetical protein